MAPGRIGRRNQTLGAGWFGGRCGQAGTQGGLTRNLEAGRGRLGRCRPGFGAGRCDHVSATGSVISDGRTIAIIRRLAGNAILDAGRRFGVSRGRHDGGRLDRARHAGRANQDHNRQHSPKQAPAQHGQGLGQEGSYGHGRNLLRAACGVKQDNHEIASWQPSATERGRGADARSAAPPIVAAEGRGPDACRKRGAVTAPPPTAAARGTL